MQGVILDASATEEGCLARGHRRVEGTLPAGTWHIVLDSWVDDEGEPRSGPYLFTLQSCSTGDTDCANDLEERSRPR